ncbi:MAG: nickel transporter [Planctomycetota bacterium]
MILDGLIAGTGHVLTGPDHLVGVAPLATDGNRNVRPALVGASWGLGHGIGVAVLGLLGQLVIGAAKIEIASQWAECLVGIVLIGFGLIALKRARSIVVHEHAHTHDGDTHVHLHVHEDGHEHRGHGARDGHGHNHAAFGIGLIHGLAGATAHYWAILPSLAMTPSRAAAYIGSYVLASMLVMTLFGAVLGKLSRSIGTAWLPRFFGVVGAITLAIGVYWTYSAFGALG